MGTHSRKWTKLVLILTLAAATAVLGFQLGVQATEQHAESMAQYKTPIPAKERPVTSLKDLNQAFVDIAASVKPTVVTVSTEKTMSVHGGGPFASPFGNDPFFQYFFGPHGGQQQQQDQPYREQGLGSGVIVSADGRILTNNHVIADVDSIYVRTFTGDRYTAKLIGTDPKTDIAVLQINAKNQPYIEVANSDSLQVGEMVMAVGSPMSENLAYTVTQGIVSATGRSNIGLADYEDFIQTDAAINPGNSGGPLVNLDGKLVGITSAIASRTGGFEGIGFAIPSNMAVHIMQSLVSTGHVVRGWLGISIQDLTPAIAKGFGLQVTSGAVIGQVQADGPAKDAGLKAGDVIVSVDGEAIENSTQLRNNIAGTKPGKTVALGILRGNDHLNIDVKLGELPGEQASTGKGGSMDERLGFAVQTLTPQLAKQYDVESGLTGVVVTSLNQSSAAARAGLREGDLIQGVSRQEVDTREQFLSALSDVKSGEMVLLQVYRGGGGFYIAFNIG